MASRVSQGEGTEAWRRWTIRCSSSELAYTATGSHLAPGEAVVAVCLDEVLEALRGPGSRFGSGLTVDQANRAADFLRSRFGQGEE